SRSVQFRSGSWALELSNVNAREVRCEAVTVRLVEAVMTLSPSMGAALRSKAIAAPLALYWSNRPKLWPRSWDRTLPIDPPHALRLSARPTMPWRAEERTMLSIISQAWISRLVPITWSMRNRLAAGDRFW